MELLIVKTFAILSMTCSEMSEVVDCLICGACLNDQTVVGLRYEHAAFGGVLMSFPLLN